jgi:hypothetical protein
MSCEHPPQRHPEFGEMPCAACSEQDYIGRSEDLGAGKPWGPIWRRQRDGCGWRWELVELENGRLKAYATPREVR